MILDFSSEGEVKANMVNYVKQMIKVFPEETESFSVPNYLFDIRDNAGILPEKDAVIFHNMVVKGLFLCRKARPNI